MEPDKHLKNSSSIKDVINRVKQIKNLEHEIVDLKKQLLLDSAIGKQTTVSSDNNPAFLLLKTKGELLAAPLKYIEEVVEIPKLIPLPTPVPSIAGMVNYHGDLLAVIDVNLINTKNSDNTAESELNLDQMLVICSVEDRKFSLLIDEAVEVISISDDHITMSDSVMPGIIKNSGILNLPNGKTAIIIDLLWIAVGTHLGTVLNNDAITATTPVSDK